LDQLQAIRVFVRIAEAGSFAKAADTLDLPRSLHLPAGLEVPLLFLQGTHAPETALSTLATFHRDVCLRTS